MVCCLKCILNAMFILENKKPTFFVFTICSVVLQHVFLYIIPLDIIVGIMYNTLFTIHIGRVLQLLTILIVMCDSNNGTYINYKCLILTHHLPYTQAGFKKQVHSRCQYCVYVLNTICTALNILHIYSLLSPYVKLHVFFFQQCVVILNFMDIK